LFRQYLAISFVALCSQSWSVASRIISTAANHLGLWAVGIGRLMPCFPRNIKLLCEQFQYNPALFGINRLNPLTEDFTEWFLMKVFNDHR
jgi:hypothetical protein